MEEKVYVETQEEKCWLEIRSLEILSASEVTEVEEGKSDEDLRRRVQSLAVIMCSFTGLQLNQGLYCFFT